VGAAVTGPAIHPGRAVQPDWTAELQEKIAGRDPPAGGSFSGSPVLGVKMLLDCKNCRKGQEWLTTKAPRHDISDKKAWITVPS